MATIPPLMAPPAPAPLRVPHLFNGRLLSAEDLSDERSAQSETHRRLGQAIGSGVVWGFGVRENVAQSIAGKAVVTIDPGLAINRAGNPIRLLQAIDFILPNAAEPSGAAPGTGSPFASCCGTAAPQGFLTGEGVYVLLVHNSEIRSGLAPVAGLGNVDSPCNARHIVETVAFCVRKLPFTAAELADTPRLRNLAAHRCFGTADGRRLTFLADPFGLALDEYGALDFLGECHVPLALVAIRPPGGANLQRSPIEFVDIWSARRRPVHRPGNAQWDPLAGDRSTAEGEAALFQFEDHIETLAATATPATLSAKDHFHFLPAAGLLPMGSAGFSVDRFFKNWTTVTEVQGDPGYLRALLHESFFVEPIEIAAPPPVLVYRFPTRPAYVLFARSELAPPAPVTTPPSDPAPADPKPHDGAFLIVVTTRKESLPKNAIIRVWVQSRKGTNAESKQGIEATRVDVASDRQLRKIFERLLDKLRAGQLQTPGKLPPDLKGAAAYYVKGVPPGDYFVKATAVGHEAASSLETLADGETHPVLLVLEPTKPVRPGRPRDPKKPGKVIPLRPPLTDKRGHRWEKILILPDPPPEKIRPDDGFTDPVPDYLDQFDAVLQEHLDRDPEQLFSAKTAGLLIRKDYTVAGNFDSPYAVVMTSDGTQFPALLVPQDHALTGNVSPAAAEVPDLATTEALARLGDAGLTDLDLVASAYGSLVADTLEVTLDIARSIVGDARAGIAVARRNFAHYPGMTPGAAAKLREGGFDDVKLANATPAELAELDPLLKGAFGQRIIEHARQFVPKDAWALNAPALELAPNQVEALNALGIESHGDFEKAGKDANRQPLLAALGLDAAHINQTTTAIATVENGIRSERLPQVSLTALPGIDAGTAETLVDGGIHSAADLGKTETSRLSTLIEVAPEKAASLVVGATKLTVAASLALTADETNKVVGNAANLNVVANNVAAAAGSAGTSRDKFIAQGIAGLALRR